MQVANLRLTNFRGIDNQTYSFTDELGRVNKITLIVGPNGSGKSSILDAIWFGLQKIIGYPSLRRDFREEPEYVVTSGRRFATLEFEVYIDEQERARIQGWKQELIDLNDMRPSPKTTLLEGKLTWTYPAQPGYDELGYTYHNKYDWDILKAKDYARRLKRLQAYSTGAYHLAGGVYLFEQERQIITSPQFSAKSDEKGEETTEGSSVNILDSLVDWGIKSRLGKLPKHDNWYKNIQEGYNAICSPNQMGEVFAPRPDSDYNIEFTRSDGTTYTFYGLSSGERAVLNFLVTYFKRRMFNSIVLIDELELNLHPIWQRRLLRYLEKRDDGNQLIITTHSPSLRDFVPDNAIIDLGKLEDDMAAPAWQLEGEGQ